MKLKILLQYRNRYLYIAMSLSLLILVINSVTYLIVAIPFLYYIYKNHSDLVKVILIFIGIYIISLFVFNNLEIKEKAIYNVTVIKDIKTDDYTSFLGKINHQYIKVYFDENISIKPGDKLIIKGLIDIPSVSTIPNTFDYNDYLKSQNVKYTIFTDYIEKDGSSFSIYLLPYYIEKYIDKYQPLSGGYVKTFILAEKSGIDVEIKNQINQIGISHLFAVSGLHIAILVLTLEFFLKKTKLLKKQKEN